jgi:hypothetical protein
MADKVFLKSEMGREKPLITEITEAHRFLRGFSVLSVGSVVRYL